MSAIRYYSKIGARYGNKIPVMPGDKVTAIDTEVLRQTLRRVLSPLSVELTDDLSITKMIELLIVYKIMEDNNGMDGIDFSFDPYATLSDLLTVEFPNFDSFQLADNIICSDFFDRVISEMDVDVFIVRALIMSTPTSVQLRIT